MRAFVLSGGGAHGDFQLGAIRFLFDQGLTPDALVATSIGSIHAAKLAEGSLADGTPERPGDALAELEAIWLGLERDSDMWRERPWFAEVKRLAFVDLPRYGGEVDAAIGTVPEAIHTAVNPIATVLGAFGVVHTLESLRELESALSAIERDETSLFDLSPIQERLVTEVRPERVAASGIRLRMSVVQLESGDVRFIDENAQFTDDGSTSGPLSQGVLASASIPVFFPVVSLAGRTYVDGGVRETLPVAEAIRMGADDIWAIAAGPTTMAEVPPPRGLLSVGQRSLDIVTTEVQRNETSPENGWPVPVNLIEPRLANHSSFEIEPRRIRISRDYGWMCAEDVYRTLHPRRRIADRIGSPAGVRLPLGFGARLSTVLSRLGSVLGLRGRPPSTSHQDFAASSEEIIRLRSALLGPESRLIAAGDGPTEESFLHLRRISEAHAREVLRQFREDVLEARRLKRELYAAVSRRLDLGLRLPPWIANPSDWWRRMQFDSSYDPWRSYFEIPAEEPPPPL